MQAEWIRLFGKKLADKWQIPTFMLAAVLAALGVYHLFAQQKQTSTEEYIRWCNRWVEQKNYIRAGALAGELLKDSSIDSPQREQLHYLAARIIHETEIPFDQHSPQRLKAFHLHFRQAGKDRTLTASDHRMLADIYRWEGRNSQAVEHLQSALDLGDPERTVLLKQMIELLPRTGMNLTEEYRQKLDDLLAQKNLKEDDLVWALDLKTERLFKEGQFDRAVKMLQTTLPRVTSQTSQLHLQYSLALGQYYQNENDQSEPTLRSILDHLSTRNDLEAKVCLLLGKICDKDDRPQEAKAFYDQVIESHPLTDYHLAALVGQAETCVRLQRYSEAQNHYRQAFSLLEKRGPNPLITREQILSSVEKAGDDLFKQGDLAQALVFAHLQNEFLGVDDNRARHALLAKMGTWHRLLAELRLKQANRVAIPELTEKLKTESRDNFKKAGDSFLILSQTPGLLDRNAALELWKAAQCYENGQITDRAEDVLETFVKNWPNDANLPEALFKLAKMHQDKNELTPAEDYYRRLIDEFTRTPFGQQSLVPLAQCYFSRGPKFYPQAERVLRDLVDDTSNQELFNPDSAEFRGAMFLLGKIYYYKGDYELCVSRLEEALERYPNDRSEPEARFLIAQSYRKIAEETNPKIARTNDRQIKSALTRSREQNLLRAQELYALAIPVFEKMTSRSPLEDTYLQLAYLYAADILYDLGLYDQAIRAYERLIEKYEKTPLALDSYVQIVNSFQRLGQVGRIKAVLERMKWLLKQIPDQALAPSGRPFSRADWQTWIDWNYKSGLLDAANPNYLAQSPDQTPGN